jgi:hypothetical protein
MPETVIQSHPHTLARLSHRQITKMRLGCHDARAILKDVVSVILADLLRGVVAHRS